MQRHLDAVSGADAESGPVPGATAFFGGDAGQRANDAALARGCTRYDGDDRGPPAPTEIGRVRLLFCETLNVPVS